MSARDTARRRCLCALCQAIVRKGPVRLNHLKQGETLTRFFIAALAAGAIAHPAYAQDQETPIPHTGFRVEARATYETPTLSDIPEKGDVAAIGNAVAFGGELGFDLAVNSKFALGPFVTFETSNVETCDATGCIVVGNTVAGGLHALHKITRRSSVYAKVGYARMAIAAHLRTRTLEESGSGMMVALGFEYDLGGGLYARVESGYADTGTIFGNDFQRRTSTISVGARF